jgi:hypothetical protein
MIRIVVSAPAKTGFFPYRIDGHWGPGGAPLIGIAENPVAEACRVLQALGVSGWDFIQIRMGQDVFMTTLNQGIARLPPPPRKALPAPRRARRKALVARGSGIPGDG